MLFVFLPETVFWQSHHLYMKTNIKFFVKLIPKFLMVIVRHVQSTKNKFAISLQYLQKEGKDEVDFCNVDKHKLSFRLVQSIFVGMASHTQIYPK